MIFRNRAEAGTELVKLMERNAYKPDLVISCSMKGLEVGREISKNFQAGQRLKMTEKLLVPGKDVAFGAVTEDGTMWIDDALRQEFDISSEYIDTSKEIKSERLKNLSRSYRGDFDSLKGRNVLLIDQGISEGFKAGAALGSILKKGPKHISIATPVISSNRRVELVDVADQLFYLEKKNFLPNSDRCYVE